MNTITQFDQIKTFEDACQVEGLNPSTVIPDFSSYPEEDRPSMIAHAKLVIIVRAANRLANGGARWIPDFGNAKQYKYFPWFYMDGGSSGFRFVVGDGWVSVSGVGSRLCFISSEVCRYVGETFIDLYNEYFL